MRITILAGLILATALPLVLSATPVQAQATRTWVSGVGDDANPCSRTAPCKTFAGSISKTAAGGEINCIDPGGFGGVTITKSITIACDNVTAGVLVSGTNGITVNSATAIVVLRGLDIAGVGTGLAGVNILAAQSVQIDKCLIHDFNAGANTGWGIRVVTAAASELYVTNTIISNNGSAATGGGILVQPTATGTVMGVLSEVQMVNNQGGGLVVDGSLSTGTQIQVAVRDSISVGSAVNGVAVVSAAGKAPARATIDRTLIIGNTANGVLTSGSGADATLAYSVITKNGTGTGFAAPATLRTYGTNQLKDNTSDGLTSGPVPLQ